MLQRHMLSQQFPGLINPLLSGFPGFPGGPSPFGLPNPLQQLLAGQKAAPPSGSSRIDDLKEAASQDTLTTKKRRYKCSKCQLKFKKREDCLRHIHSTHSAASANSLRSSSARRLQFSPSKARNRGVRSHYVKRLMEILKVPTSRGTPSKVNSNHIMQAFLIKKDNDNEVMKSEDEAANDEAAADDFVPSMVYLPVARKINQPLTVAFSLTPA